MERSALRGQLHVWRSRKRMGVPRGISNAQKTRNRLTRRLRLPSKRSMRAAAKRHAWKWMKHRKKSVRRLIEHLEHKRRSKKSKKMKMGRRSRFIKRTQSRFFPKNDKINAATKALKEK